MKSVLSSTSSVRTSMTVAVTVTFWNSSRGSSRSASATLCGGGRGWKPVFSSRRRPVQGSPVGAETNCPLTMTCEPAEGTSVIAPKSSTAEVLSLRMKAFRSETCITVPVTTNPRYLGFARNSSFSSAIEVTFVLAATESAARRRIAAVINLRTNMIC